MLLACPAVGDERVSIIKQNIRCWLSTKTLVDLVTSFGGVVPDGLSLERLVDWYLDFSDCWDYRSHQANAMTSATSENGYQSYSKS